MHRQIRETVLWKMRKVHQQARVKSWELRPFRGASSHEIYIPAPGDRAVHALEHCHCLQLRLGGRFGLASLSYRTFISYENSRALGG